MEARKIRIGNDIRITWTLNDEEGNPYIIEAESYEIWLACYGYRQKTAAVVTGNVAEFTFYGKDQRTAGSYALLLIENRGGIPMVTYDVKDVFRLVDHSWETGTDGEPPEGIAVDEAVDIDSTLVPGETKKVRLGNDLTIRWSLIDRGTPYNLAGRDFEVWMACYGYRQKVTALTVSGNEITFTFFGKDQRVAGSYALLYCENKGQPAMLTYDTKDAFELVEHSWDTDEDDESDVVTDTVELVSQITAIGISAEQIIEALGYVPANVEDVPAILFGTTAFWNGRVGYIPPQDTIIVYTDKATVDGVNVPGIKVGSGNAYVQDLAFVADDIAADIYAHIQDNVRHITAEERAAWNNKLNVEDVVLNKTLVFTRN